MTTDPIDRIAERLQGVKPTARGITALCPAHDDHKPSLDVDRGDDGRALVTCRAGCQTSEVLGTIGMTMADLYADRKPVNGTAKPKPTKTPTIHETRERALSALLWSIRKKTEEGSYEIAKTYDYTDAAGAVVSVAVRIESPEAPKTFGQIRPEGNGWACGGPERPILYRLPEMIEAGPDSFVFVTEGEKDADRLAALGLVATCNPMGAGKWRGVDDEALRDRHLVIVPDNDEPGEAHAEQVADLTRSKAASVRVLNLPDLPHKGDVSDWLDAGGDVEAMVSLAENSPLWTPSEPEPEPEQPKAKRPTVANVDIVKAQGDDGEETTVTVARPPQDIAGDVFARVGPVYALGNRGLFTPEGEAVRMLGDDAAAFAWVKERASLYWVSRAKRGGNPVNRAELVAHLRARPAATFDDLATLPHHPEVAGTFYTGPKLPKPNPARLTEFIDHLNPDTDTDKALLEAALLTPGWGGPCGARPAFVLASDHGRGSGKTITAESIASIWGGSIDCNVSTRDGIDRLRQRLLHDDKAARRVVLLDNLKGTTNSAEIESLITAGEIQGHKLYSGDASRPNRLSWFITANKPHMSRDLADRSAIVRIGKPKRADFAGWASEFIERHRLELVATVIDRLQGPPLCSIPADCRDRWTAWQDAVLSRVRGGDAAAAAIIERRPSVDADAEDWDETEGEIRALIRAVGHDPDTEAVAMPLNTLALRLSEATGVRFTPKGLASKLGEYAGVDGAEQFTRNPCKSHGRTWVWQPAQAPYLGRVEYPDWDRLNPRTLERMDRWT